MADSSQLVVGEIRAFAFGGPRFAAEMAALGWIACEGQELNSAQFGELSRRLGTAWGSVSPGNVFNVPDLRGHFLRGWNHDARDGDNKFFDFDHNNPRSH